MSGNLTSESCHNEQQTQTFTQGEAVQIIGIDKKRFVLNEKNLMNILHKTNKPIVIISIVGSFRTGKSFMLNSFLQYLKLNHNNLSTSSSIPNHDIKNLFNDNNGFNWAYGSNSHTKGIWMWDTPLDYRIKEQQVSILLMDTQGIFDNDISQKECAAIFSVSAFMSSVQIFNIKNNIEKRDLEYLSIFAQYKAISEKTFNKIFKLEQLTFLIRDWQFPDEYCYGFDGGEKLLKARLEICQSDLQSKQELNDLLMDLKKFFTKRNCFLMPHPGPIITKKDFNGNPNDLDTEFKESCQLFFKKTLQNINLSENKMRSNIFRNGQNLFNLFKEYIDVLESNNLPNFESITMVYSKHNNLMCRQTELDFYRNTMTDFISSDIPYIKIDILDQEHKKTLNKCLDNYTIYAMETVNFRIEFVEMKNLILDIYESFKTTADKQNKHHIQNLKEISFNDYKTIIKKFCDDKSTYQKPIDLFLKHQNTKVFCLKEFEKYRYLSTELKREYDDLNMKMDEILGILDRENCYKKNLLSNQIKSECINKYRCTMNLENQIENNTHLELEEFHEKHLMALTICINQFEKLTMNDKDLNNDYEDLLANDVRGLYASYYMQNANKTPKYIPYPKRIKKLLEPISMKLIDYNYNLMTRYTRKSCTLVNRYTHKSSQNEFSGNESIYDDTNSTSTLMQLFQFFMFIIMFFIHNLMLGFSYLYKFIFDSQISSSGIFELILLMMKTSWLHAREFLMHFLYTD